MKAKKIIALVLCAVLLAAALTGCRRNGDDGNTTTNPNADGVSEAGSGKADYAVVLKTLSSDYWVKMKEGIEAEAADLGVTVDIFAAQSEDDAAGQLTVLENCLTRSYKAVGVAPISSADIINGIVKANEKGVYVVNIGEKIDIDSLRKAGGSVIAIAKTDNEEVGQKGAQFIINQLGEKGGDVAIIEGKAGDSSGEYRKAGATKTFEAKNNIKLVVSKSADGDRQKALDTATSYIQAYPNLKAIYCCDDTMALGALQAVINADKLDEIIIVGTDGTAQAIESIEAGQLSATVAQDPAEIGAVALRKMVEAVKDQPKLDPNAQPDTISIDSYVVTKDNVK